MISMGQKRRKCQSGLVTAPDSGGGSNQMASAVRSGWATRRRRAENASDQQLQKVPSARTIARLMTSARDHMSKADTVIIAAIEAGVPTLVTARTFREFTSFDIWTVGGLDQQVDVVVLAARFLERGAKIFANSDKASTSTSRALSLSTPCR